MVKDDSDEIIPPEQGEPIPPGYELLKHVSQQAERPATLEELS